jgi:hypothetical protein
MRPARDHKEYRAMTFAFANGVLDIRSPLGDMRIRWRPEPLAEELPVAARVWRPWAPEFRLLSLSPEALHATAIPEAFAASDVSAMEAKVAAFAAFRDEIPQPILQAVARFQSHQWLLMLLLHRQPAVFDLVKASPVLAYCLANNDQFRGTKSAVSLLLALGHSRQKQRTLLEWLGFPGSEAMARIVRRIAPEAVSPSLLRRLRNAIQVDPALVAQLAHVPTLNAGALELVLNPFLRPLVAPRLLLNVAGLAEELSFAQTADQLATALALQRQMNEPAPEAPFSTQGQIARFQERMDAAYQDWPRRQEEARQREEQRQQAERARRRASLDIPPEPPRRVMPIVQRPIPPPPVPGTPHIAPITTAQALYEEGEAQSNCVASYLPNIADGFCYIYRVTAPERATLSIVPTSDGGWRRSELKGPRNRKVRPLTRQTVDWWLYQHRLSVA